MDLPSQFFSTKSPPTAFTPEPVRRRVAGMKQILLILMAVALVGVMGTGCCSTGEWVEVDGNKNNSDNKDWIEAVLNFFFAK
jgi:hypothetical protein